MVGQPLTPRLYTSDAGMEYRLICATAARQFSVGIFQNAQERPGIIGTPTAYVRRNTKQIGIQARKIRVRFFDQLPPGYSDRTLLIPVFSRFSWGIFTIGREGTYLTLPVTIVGRIPEKRF